jgi:septum formation protein
MKKIILASGSPRRKMLLEWAELKFEIRVSDVDESFPNEMSPLEVASFIARKKNIVVFESLEMDERDKSIVVSADTIVVLDDEIIGKPVDRADAISILKRLRSRDHFVITGVNIKSIEKEISLTDQTKVGFHQLTDEQIEHYVDVYKPYDKAGAYAIQEWIGVVGIDRIEGDFYNVMGLPISKVLKSLEENFNI